MNLHILDDLRMWLDDAQHALKVDHSIQANLPRTAQEESRARQKRAEEYATELADLVRQAARQHPRRLIGRKLRTPKGESICELRYTTGNKDEPDRGVRFRIHYLTDSLEVWWLPIFPPSRKSDDIEFVVVGHMPPDAMPVATVSQIDFLETVATIIHVLIAPNSNWHHGMRPRLTPVPKAAESSVQTEPPAGTPTQGVVHKLTMPRYKRSSRT